MIKTIILGNHLSNYQTFHQFIASINDNFLQNLNFNDIEIIIKIMEKNEPLIKI